MEESMKKVLSFTLVLLMLFGIFPISSSAEDNDFVVVKADELFYLVLNVATLDSSLEKSADGDYVHLVAAPGSYGNSELVVSFSKVGFNTLDYPYVAVGYRTDSQSGIVDVGQVNAMGENWCNNNPAQQNDGKWHTLISNFNDITGNTTPNLPRADEEGVVFRLKPWQSHNKTLDTEQYYDVMFIAYFKTADEAKNFKFDPNKDYGGELVVDFGEEIPYYKADDELINSYLDKAYALKDEIINSKTDVTYTGTAYYVSNKGNDKNDGLTPATAFKTAKKVSGADFLKEGDAVLFERGSIFRNDFTFQTVNGVTYSAYGNGAKPKFIGSIDASAPSDWLTTEWEDVYEYREKLEAATRDVGVIVFDLGKAWGVKMMSGVKNGDGNVITNGLESFVSGGYPIKSGADLKNDLEFWHDPYTGTLYLKSVGGAPAERFTSIELNDKGSGIAGGAQNVTLDNLDFFGYGSHAIGYSGVGDWAPKNLTVQYCTFSFIGGSRQNAEDPENNGRLGNAVEIYGGCKGYTIHHCYADNVYDCCWTVQFQSSSGGVDVIFEDVEMYSNVACYCNTGLEIWLNNKPEFNNPAHYGMKNMRLHDNYTFYNGYGWSMQRPNPDGNIFYGDPSVTTSTYENCSVDNNVGLFASRWLYFLRYIGPDGYNFNHNIYFQQSDRDIGGIPANPGKGTGNITSHPYEENTLRKLLITGFEPGTTFYYTDPDYKIPQYTPAPIAFVDVADSHWAYNNVKTAVMRNWFNGTSETTFAPDTQMTRAMLVAVLSRLADFDVDNQTHAYTDVAADAWYAPYVNFAYNAGIIDGTGKFRPDEPATREEMADMLYRMTFAQYKCDNYNGASLSFTDAASVSAEHAAGIAFALDNGIISGYPDGSVKPKNGATRAEVATMMKRFADYYKNLESDYSYLTDKTDSIIYNAEAMSTKTSTAGFDKKLNGTVLALIPNELSSSRTGGLNFFERILKVNYSEYPYIKFRYRTNINLATFSLGATKGNNSSKAIYELDNSGEWVDFIGCYYDIFAPNTGIDFTQNGSFFISPWSESASGADVGHDFFELEYVGFFPTKAAAEAYNG